jgi:hypothetical protein
MQAMSSTFSFTFLSTLRRHLMAFALLGAALIGSTAFAQTPAETPTQPRGDFRKLDTNRDKMISKAEAANYPMLSQNFDKIDANKDGQLTRAELQAFHKANKADQDGDGNVSRAEAQNKPNLLKHFDQIDTNKDGVLTPAERQAWAQAHHGRMKK